MNTDFVAIPYSLAGPEEGAPIPVVGCSICGALTLDTDKHAAFHKALRAFFITLADLDPERHRHEIDRGAFHEQTSEGFYAGEDSGA